MTASNSASGWPKLARPLVKPCQGRAVRRASGRSLRLRPVAFSGVPIFVEVVTYICVGNRMLVASNLGTFAVLLEKVGHSALLFLVAEHFGIRF